MFQCHRANNNRKHDNVDHQVLGPLPLFENKFAVVIDNVLTPAECCALIARGERRGYKEALVNVGGGKQTLIRDYRKGGRCIIDDCALANDLFERIRQYLPQDHRDLNSPRHDALRCPLSGLNEKLRFLKYNEGDFFRPHYDGSFAREDGSEISWLTAMVYLNDGESDFQGGETCLLRPPETRNGSPEIEHTIVPKPGRVLLFDHNIYHVGQQVTGGIKLCIRTDVMYRCTSMMTQDKNQGESKQQKYHHRVTGPLTLSEKNKFAIVIDNVLTPTECLQLIVRAERTGYEEALVNVGEGEQTSMPDRRKGGRCIIDDEALANDLFERIWRYLPPEEHLKKPRRATRSLAGLNERLRFLKYNEGDFFKPHYDGCYRRPDGSEMSWMTAVVYLNDGDADFQGGETCLLRDPQETTALGEEPEVEYTLVPKPGRVFLFDHNICCAGREVTRGTKICIRTDVMYGNTS